MEEPFSIPIRVYYEDTDSGGVVYHSNYLNFMERARTEWLRSMGFEQDELRSRERVIFAVSAVDVQFHKPARFNDLVQVDVILQRRGAASLILLQRVRKDTDVLASARVRIACLHVERFVPVAIPDHVVARVAARYGSVTGTAEKGKSTRESA